MARQADLVAGRSDLMVGRSDLAATGSAYTGKVHGRGGAGRIQWRCRWAPQASDALAGFFILLFFCLIFGGGQKTTSVNLHKHQLRGG